MMSNEENKTEQTQEVQIHVEKYEIQIDSQYCHFVRCSIVMHKLHKIWCSDVDMGASYRISVNSC